MKLWGTLALLAALMVAPVSNAAADTFTLWEKFPMSANGENSFYTAAHYQSPETLVPLDYASDYSFTKDGVSVAKDFSNSMITLTPSVTGDAILYGVPPESVSLQILGKFFLPNGGDTAHVAVGTVLLSDPSTFKPLFGLDLSSSNNIYVFNEAVPYLDSSHALVFSAGREGGAAQLEALFIATPVPIPGALWLMGSGLVGLIGLRRKSVG
jgi:hypothetical protein